MAKHGLFVSGELDEVENIFKEFDVAIVKGVLFNISPEEIDHVIRYL